MAERKEYEIHIGGITESIKSTQSLNDALKEQKKEYKGAADALNDYNTKQGQSKKAQEEATNAQKSGTEALKEMRKRIKEIQGEMLQFEQGSKQWNALAKEAGDLKDKVKDAQDAINRFSSDTKRLDDVINVAKSATAAFELYKGAMSAFGMETEETEKAMQKLVGAMSIIQSLQTLQNTLKGSTATAELFKITMKATGAQLVVNQVNAIKAAAANDLLSKAQKAGAVTAKTLGLALKAIPLLLIIGLVTELVLHWEDLVGWFDKTFPALKKMGGLMNTLKATVVGLGKAIINWLTNPIKTLANVIQKVLAGDFKGAMDAALDGIKNQFTGTAKAFKEGFQDQVEKGLEDITRKQAAEQDKQLTHQKNMITKQKNADGTYRKEYIEANKKMFENRKKMYKKDSDEYRKVLEEEAQFNQQVEDAKTSATKKGAADRAKANKEAAKQAKEAAKQEEEDLKNLLTAQRALRDEVINNKILELKQLERLQQERLEAYNAGPIEKYEKELADLRAIQNEIFSQELAQTIASIGDYLEDNITLVKKSSDEWQKYISEIKSAADITIKMSDEQKAKITKDLKERGLTAAQIAESIEKIEKTQINNILSQWQKVEGLRLKVADDANAKIIDKTKKTFSVVKNEMANWSDDFQRRYNKLIENVSKRGKEQVAINNIWGTVQTGKTLANLEILKKQWEDAYVDLSAILKKEEDRWKQYLENVKSIYGEDSSAFIKAKKEKEDALKPLQDKLIEVAKRASGTTSTETDYTGDNQADASMKKLRKLWDKDGDFMSNMSNLFQSLDEMVLAPAMDTLNMFMDFAIEETQKKLEEVQDMHDDALDKVEESAERIKELNDSLKDSSNTNIEVTKQQLADEQILYAQRLAEEQKLAQEEKNLQNKANEQEYKSRQMELGYQFVMAVANTAQGASKALAQWGWPLGPIFAGTMTALGAVQSALILKQMDALPKPRKLADGGVLNGPSHAAGGIKLGNVEVEGGEAVISKNATKKFLPLLDAINAAGNGGKHTLLADKKIRKYADGGTLNFENVDSNLRQNAEANRILNAIDNINFQPQVAVVDINRVNARLTKVKSLAGR